MEARADAREDGAHYTIDEDLEGVLTHRHELLIHLVLLHHILLWYWWDDDACSGARLLQQLIITGCMQLETDLGHMESCSH